jgi:uncharacterized membrane protein YfcA
VTWLTWIEACLVIGVGAALHGTIGFGMGLVAVPILTLIDPVFVPGSVLFSGLVLAGLMAYRERRAMDVSGIKLGLVGRVAGTLLATVVLARMPTAEGMSLLLGVLVLTAVLFSVSGWRVRLTVWSLLSAGTLSGFMGTVASVGGPPMALLYQDSSGERLRSTMSGFFIFGTLISLTGLMLAGRCGRAEIGASLAVVPGVLVGFALSRRALAFLDQRYIRPAVLVVSALSGAAVVLRALL